ncbi:MAG: hypothetical protein EP330_08475 [Deltaproteobacteria bacterium]|nr:MAG: hypothetical protein EP330_08475 [Deltaproteobacteria bacterium]
MSAFITLLTPMLDEDSLVAAIVAQGFDEANLIRSEQPVPLRGWQGGRQANIVLRMEHTGDAYNDVGFLRGPTGYTAILSDDHARFGPDWLSRITGAYQTAWSAKQTRIAAAERERLEEERRHLVETQRQAVHERAKKLGYRVQETREGETIRLVLVKRTY